MRSATVTTVLDAPRTAVFEYLAEIEHLPEWATEFARELRRDGDDHKVVNGLGEFFFAVALPDGRTAYSFTMFQGPGMPDELFEAQHAALSREFANIERVFAR